MSNKTLCSCLLCHREVVTSNIDIHYNSKKCRALVYKNKCLYCESETSHDKFCSLRCSALHQHSTFRKFQKIDTANKNQIYWSCVSCKNVFTTRNLIRHVCKPKHRTFSIKSNPRDMYRYQCRFDFSIKKYSDWFEYAGDLISKYGWYSAKNRDNNLSGCSRDHLYSVSDGYKNNVDPKIISHPANCQIKPHKENQKKYSKSSITFEELLERIKLFENRYGEV